MLHLSSFFCSHKCSLFILNYNFNHFITNKLKKKFFFNLFIYIFIYLSYYDTENRKNNYNYDLEPTKCSRSYETRNG